ncbi:MAG: 4-hydroxythreonine-4-phosphate dehydrogenase PdxA, partial [Gammaproteobacteria bacterium]
MSTSRRLAITPGEPAGIGPELLVRLAGERRDCEWVAIADANLLNRAAERLGASIALNDSVDSPSTEPGTLTVLHRSLAAGELPGKLDVRNASYVVETLTCAADGCLDGTFGGIVTGPVQKSILNESGLAFTGHTEFFCERAGAADVVMLLVAGTLRVALATTHLALKAVPDAITEDLLDRRLGILLEGLERQFRISAPKVLVAGLN